MGGDRTGGEVGLPFFVFWFLKIVIGFEVCDPFCFQRFHFLRLQRVEEFPARVSKEQCFGVRYMVSAMFEEAATTAEATLQTLINKTHTKDMTGLCAPIEERDDLERESEEALQEVGTSDREAMLESAGMVLLQAYQALGRSVKSNHLN
jgi:hypothetical protein